MELFAYQQEFVDADTDVVLQGGRRVGKTTALAAKAWDLLGAGTHPLLVVTPSKRMGDLFERTFCEYTGVGSVDSLVDSKWTADRLREVFVYVTEHTLANRDLDRVVDDVEAVLIEEASYIDQEFLLTLHRACDKHRVNMATVGTPSPTREKTTFYALANDAFIRSVWAPMYESPIIPDDEISTFRDDLGWLLDLVEVHGQFPPKEE